MSQARIMSLGEVVPIDMYQGGAALTTVLFEKLQKFEENESKNQAQLVLLQMQVGNFILNLTKLLIVPFKMGQLSEEEFDAKFLEAIEKEFKVKLTKEEFNACWQKMFVPYEKYVQDLRDAIDFNKTPGQHLDFVSFTNPKDMRHLKAQLDEHKEFSYKTDKQNNEGFNFTEIGGVKVYLSYPLHKDKPELIQLVDDSLKATFTPQAPSPSVAQFSFMSPESKATGGESAGFYIYGTNRVSSSLAKLKEQFDKDSAEAKAAAQGRKLQTVLWERGNATLKQILADPKKYGTVRENTLQFVASLS